MSTREVTADEAYQVFKRNPSLTLTPDQVKAVTADSDRPTLVVAGAGSGKTELMATRVVWLVANGKCEPHQILGLTFTRKAASELSKRINNALTALAKDENLWPAGLERNFTAPNITTYNSYANTLYRDYALSLGYEDDSTLLTDASRFQLAREVVVKYGEEIDPRIVDSELSLNSVVDGVLTLAGAMNDHNVTPEEIEKYIAGFYKQIASLPASSRAKVTAEQPIGSTLLSSISGALSTPMLANLAQAFIEEKKRRSYIDFSDQVALAYRAVMELGDTVRTRESGQYTQVLLDEFQDTSTMQIELLAGLFSGQSVFAVGDPNQSIYGWRGASASNLGDFLLKFRGSGAEIEMRHLSRSWRNPKVVLKLANEILKPLEASPAFLQNRPPLPKVEIQELDAPDGAKEGQITVYFADQVANEAKFTAKWLIENMGEGPLEKRPTAAVLMRSRNMMSVFETELRDAGLNVEVVGLGGLLESPEIVDLVAALRVIHYPQAGAHLMRLLTGPRWQVEPKDIERLSRYARNLARFWNRDSKKVSGSEAEASIIDALDNLLDETESEQLPVFSERGLASLRNCAGLLRQLRSRTGMPLPEFVRAVEQELWLDIELAANPRRIDPMANLNAFANLVSGYADTTTATLGGFLEWLEYANLKERFETPSVAARNGVVQLITAHTAKGLEWDLVAVPRLVEGSFPGVQSTQGWLSSGELPFALRGDAASLPSMDFSGCDDQTAAGKVIEQFKKVDQFENLMREERRLAYVAFTRPKHKLLLSGSKWKPGVKNASQPSQFLVEAALLSDPRIEVIDRVNSAENPLPTYEELDTNPADLTALKEIWPMEPLGEKHRKKVNEAKCQVDQAIQVTAPSRSEIDDTIDRLLAERELLITRSQQVKLPVRISASRFKEFVFDLPKIVEMYRRPLPERPYKQTMAGTLFHSWIEARFGALNISDELDSMGLEPEDSATEKTMDELKATFEASRFAKMIPYSIEGEIQVTIKGNTFICKLDAVFKTENGYEIVDWKTGKPPVTEKEISDRSLQLALYRMAFSRLHKVNPDQIEVCLYYVADDLEIKPELIPDEAELISLWDSVLEKVVS